MNWGRGGFVGINKAIYEQKKAQEQAAFILASECGVKHTLGSRADLCPKCQASAAEPRLQHPLTTEELRGEMT